MKKFFLQLLVLVLGGLGTYGGSQGWKWYNTAPPAPSAACQHVIDSMVEGEGWSIAKGEKEEYLFNAKAGLKVESDGTVTAGTGDQATKLTTFSGNDKSHVRSKYQEARSKVEELTFLSKLVAPAKKTETKVETTAVSTEQLLTEKDRLGEAKAIAEIVAEQAKKAPVVETKKVEEKKAVEPAKPEVIPAKPTELVGPPAPTEEKPTDE